MHRHYVASYRSSIVNNEERDIKFCLLDSLLKAVGRFCPLGLPRRGLGEAGRGARTDGRTGRGGLSVGAATPGAGVEGRYAVPRRPRCRCPGGRSSGRSRGSLSGRRRIKPGGPEPGAPNAPASLRPGRPRPPGAGPVLRVPPGSSQAPPAPPGLPIPHRGCGDSRPGWEARGRGGAVWS